MALTLSEKLKTGAVEGPAPIMPRVPESAHDSILIRHLAPNGEFLGAVQCPPGGLAVVQESAALETPSSAFRAAMLNRSPEMSIRAGQETLHPSEIYVVQVSDRLLNAPTVEAAMREAGVPERDLPDLLRRVGLDGAVTVQPKDLGISALKRLAIAVSMYAKARVLLFDRPFAGSDPAWVERIAQLLLQVGEVQARAVIITGEARLPAAWRAHPRVAVYDGTSAATAPLGAGNGDAAQRLMQASLQLQPRPGEMVTRPQLIHPGTRGATPEAMATEAIPNPNATLKTPQLLGGDAGTGGLAFETSQQVRRETIDENPYNEYRRQRKGTGTLTQVKPADRWKQTWIADTYGAVLKKVSARWTGRPATIDLPRSAKLQHVRRQSDLRLYTIVFMLMMLMACGVYWLTK